MVEEFEGNGDMDLITVSNPALSRVKQGKIRFAGDYRDDMVSAYKFMVRSVNPTEEKVASALINKTV